MDKQIKGAYYPKGNGWVADYENAVGGIISTPFKTEAEAVAWLQSKGATVSKGRLVNP
jgi:hypothetical protein